jgi:hypothetical protein
MTGHVAISHHSPEGERGETAIRDLKADQKSKFKADFNPSRGTGLAGKGV